MRVLLCLALFAMCGYLSAAIDIKLAAFNIQVFGKSKMSKSEVVDDLVEILRRYDITLIQEIRDIDQIAIYELLDKLNAKTGNAYDEVLGPRVGRTSSKEQYCYFYKPSLFDVDDSYTFDDSSDQFERPPFNVKFRHRNTEKSFWLSGLHAKPDEAVAEMNAMVEVYDDIVERPGLGEVLMLGDFNADCSYVKENEWDEILLWTDDRFTWPLGKEEDTTVRESTDCAYDRFVITDGITIKQPSVYNFMNEFGLSEDQALDVSDHYPIEITVVL